MYRGKRISGGDKPTDNYHHALLSLSSAGCLAAHSMFQLLSEATCLFHSMKQWKYLKYIILHTPPQTLTQLKTFKGTHVVNIVYSHGLIPISAAPALLRVHIVNLDLCLTLLSPVNTRLQSASSRSCLHGKWNLDLTKLLVLKSKQVKSFKTCRSLGDSSLSVTQLRLEMMSGVNKQE